MSKLIELRQNEISAVHGGETFYKGAITGGIAGFLIGRYLAISVASALGAIFVVGSFVVTGVLVGWMIEQELISYYYKGE